MEFMRRGEQNMSPGGENPFDAPGYGCESEHPDFLLPLAGGCDSSTTIRTGIEGALTMAVAVFAITAAAMAGSAQLSFDPAPKFAALLFTMFAMALREIVVKQSHQIQFDFSSARALDAAARARIKLRIFALILTICIAAATMMFAKLYFTDASTLFLFGLPFLVISHVVYFFVVEKHARKESTVDEFLVLGSCAKRVLLGLIGKGDKSDAQSAMRNQYAWNLVRTIMVKTHFVIVMTFYALIAMYALEKEARKLIALLQGGSGDVAAIYTAFSICVIEWLFSVDTAMALVGYVTSSRLLNNQSAATEHSWKGIAYTMVCYHPFNFLMQAAIFGSLNYCWPEQWLNDMPFIAYPATLTVLFLFFVYVSATLAFGVRFSNLSNRGIVTGGPYRLIRHPSYASKNIGWWICLVPMIAAAGSRWPMVVVPMVLISFVYAMRGITEEQFLSREIAYQDYCKRVRWRFIPGVF